jgi:hypothetical protein
MVEAEADYNSDGRARRGRLVPLSAGIPMVATEDLSTIFGFLSALLLPRFFRSVKSWMST